MKFNLKHIRVFVLMAIYCIAINAPVKAVLADDSNIIIDNKGEVVYSQNSLQLNLYTSEAFNVLQPVVVSDLTDGNNLFKIHFGFAPKSEYIIGGILTPHTNSLLSFQAPFRAHDIIFPFHYFW